MDVMLRWEGDLRFQATGGARLATLVDGDTAAGLSPMETLLAALGACMGADIVDILRKGRQELTAVAIRASGTRREQPPRRFLTIALAIELEGRALDRTKAERAVELSRKTYCSVWNSLAPDIELDVTLAIRG
jgi:putative redox protein